MLDREIPGLEWFAQQPESTLIRGCRRRRVRRCSSPAAPRPWLVAEAARARASLREGETPWTKPQLTTRGGTSARRSNVARAPVPDTRRHDGADSRRRAVMTSRSRSVFPLAVRLGSRCPLPVRASRWRRLESTGRLDRYGRVPYGASTSQ